jgi:DNA primase
MNLTDGDGAKYSKNADPDLYIREMGVEAYTKLLKDAPPYVDYLIGRARHMDLSTGEGKLRAVNFLLPYVQKIPNRLLRSEWATRIAQQLRRGTAQRFKSGAGTRRTCGQAGRAPLDPHARGSRHFST